jgi:tetratricopeptide (TPR) repeat protein
MKNYVSLILFLVCSLIRGEVYSESKTDNRLSYGEILDIAGQIAKDLLEGRENQALATIDKMTKEQTRTAINDIAVIPVLGEVFEKDTYRFSDVIETLETTGTPSMIGKILKVEFYRSYAWQARGSQYIRETAEEALDLYQTRLKTASVELEGALKIAPKHWLPAFYLLSMAKELGLPDSLRDDAFKKAIDGNPNFYGAYAARVYGLAPKWGGDAERMLSFARAVAKTNDPNSSLPLLIHLAHGNLADQFGGRKKYYRRPEVWEELQRASEVVINRFPNAGYPKSRYAESLFLVGKKEQAIELLRKAHQLDPRGTLTSELVGKHPEVLETELPLQTSTLDKDLDKIRNDAKKLFHKKQWDAAYQKYMELNQKNGMDGESFALFGYTHIKIGKHDQAIQYLDKAISLKPYNSKYVVYRCHAKMVSGDLQGGINDCTKAIGLNTREKNAYLNRALAYERLGRMTEAKEDRAIAASLND